LSIHDEAIMTDQPLRQMLSACFPVRDLPAEIEDHLAEAAGTEEERAELRLTVLALRHLPPASLPRSFIIDDVTLQRYRRGRRTGAVQWALRSVVASAAVLLVAVGVGDLRQSLEPPAPAATVVVTAQVQALAAEPATEARPLLGGPAQPQIPTSLYRGLEVALAGVAAAAGGALWWTSRRTRAE
jgi:hypothetical protein